MRAIPIALVIASLTSISSASADDTVTEQIKSLTEQVRTLTEMLEELKEVVDRQQERIDTLEEENETLKQETFSPPPPPTAPAAPAGASKPSGGFNPEIGVVVDIVGSVTESSEDEEGNDRFSVRELELTIGHDIDPFARFDSTITFSDFEDVEIEEAYVTIWEVPGGFQLRTGRMRPRIGKATAVHRDRLDTVDEPFVVQRYLGIEGLFRTGVEVSRYLPQAVDPLTQELIFGILEGGVGEDGTLFGDVRRHPTYFARLKNALEFSHDTNLELGGTYLLGSAGEDGRNDVHAAGADLTLQHYFTPIRKLKWQSEMYAQFRDDDVSTNDDPLGFYTLLDYRLSPRWGFGGRFDWVELVDADPLWPDDTDRGYSVYLTFFQSEFARWRLQYQLADLADGDEDNRFFLQGTFAIGTHKHKIQ